MNLKQPLRPAGGKDWDHVEEVAEQLMEWLRSGGLARQAAALSELNEQVREKADLEALPRLWRDCPVTPATGEGSES